MYNTNVTAIRQLEVFEARRRLPPADRIRVYFLIHARTVEEQAYLTSLRREKAAFELIIDTKSVSGAEFASFAIQNIIISIFPTENGYTRVPGWQDR